MIEITKSGLEVKSERQIKVYYFDDLVGTYFSDLLVDDKIIIEIKAMEALREEHEFQLLNYLKATDVEVGLLLNFGKKPEFRRLIFSNENKHHL